MKFTLLLAASICLVSCSGKDNSGSTPTRRQPPVGLVESPPTQELKVIGLGAANDGINKVGVSYPNATAQDVIFTVEAKTTGSINLTFQGNVSIGCDAVNLKVTKVWEDMTGGNLQSTAEAVGNLPMVAGHSYRIRYSVTAAGSCDGFAEEFKATFAVPAEDHSEDATPPAPLKQNCANEIEMSQFWRNAKQGDWCEHEVTDPTKGVISGHGIYEGARLYKGAKLAIVYGTYSFSEAQSVCVNLGNYYMTPLSQSPSAEPRATEHIASAESIGQYLEFLRIPDVWTGSSHDSDTESAKFIQVGDGTVSAILKSAKLGVICIH